MLALFGSLIKTESKLIPEIPADDMGNASACSAERFQIESLNDARQKHQKRGQKPAEDELRHT